MVKKLKTFYSFLTHERDGQTNTQTPHDSIGRAYAEHRASKKLRSRSIIVLLIIEANY